MNNSFNKITESGVSGFDVQRFGIWLLSEDRTVLRCEDLFERDKGLHSNDQELSETDYPDYFAQIILGEIIAAEDVNSDPRTSGFSDSYLTPFDITSMLDIPIRVSGEIAGVLCIEHTGTQRRWSVDDVNFGLSLADLVALIIEISHRKHTEKELIKSETRNKALLDAVPDMIFRVKRNGTYLEFIPGKGIKTIVPESDFIGKTISDIVPTETAQLIMETIENVLQTGMIQVSEYQFLISDEIHHREARFIGLGKDEVMIIERDVSERKKAEESLKRHSEELKNFNNIMVDREMRIIELKEEVNKLAEDVGKDVPYPAAWEEEYWNSTV
jgi:PAS domain S-box-containing protein